MQNKSSIFIRHLTVVDLAFVSPLGLIEGESFHPSFVVTGPVTEDEQVVIDFGKCKKRIKALIDDYQNGFDHKLWIIPGYSNCNFEIDSGRIKVSSDRFSLDAPEHAVRVVDDSGNFDIVRIAEKAFETYLTENLQAEFPGVSVKCNNNRDVFWENNFVRFNYAHFLPQSSSLPCKRCWHGHGSFIESDADIRILNMIKSVYENVLFINRKYVKEIVDNKVYLDVTNDLGDTYRSVVNSDHHDIIFMDVDTTIENITAHIADKFGDFIKESNGTYLAVSEGLSKGSVVYF